MQASRGHALPHNTSSHIGAVHVDAALAELAADAAFPPLPSVSNTCPTTFAAAWAARQQAAASCTAVTAAAAAPGLSVDAEDVAPRPPAATAATTPNPPPARREGATSAVLAGCALAYPTPAQPASTQPPAAYVPPHRCTPEQQAAAAEEGRPGRPFPLTHRRPAAAAGCRGPLAAVPPGPAVPQPALLTRCPAPCAAAPSSALPVAVPLAAFCLPHCFPPATTCLPTMPPVYFTTIVGCLSANMKCNVQWPPVKRDRAAGREGIVAQGRHVTLIAVAQCMTRMRAQQQSSLQVLNNAHA